MYQIINMLSCHWGIFLIICFYGNSLLCLVFIACIRVIGE
mgnify:CR=1 FL=1